MRWSPCILHQKSTFHNSPPPPLPPPHQKKYNHAKLPFGDGIQIELHRHLQCRLQDDIIYQIIFSPTYSGIISQDACSRHPQWPSLRQGRPGLVGLHPYGHDHILQQAVQCELCRSGASRDFDGLQLLAVMFRDIARHKQEDRAK